MANLLQGTPYPNVQTTQTNATTAPDWYNNYLSSLPTQTQNAINAGGTAGPSPLQATAYASAPTAITAGQPATNQAANYANMAGSTPATSMVSDYMNPFTSSVLDEINRRGQANWQQTVAPVTTSGAVGSGQFGGSRGAQALANAGRDVNANILGTQATTAAAGFDAALKAAQAQQGTWLKTGEDLSTIGTNQYNQGIGGLNALSTLGGQQQSTEQAALNYPMTALSNQASIMKGLSVPTSQTQTFKGPMPGAYQTSPLAQMLGYTTGAGSIFSSNNGGKSVWETLTGSPSVSGGLSSVSDLLKSWFNSGGNSGGSSTPNEGDVDSQGRMYVNGQWVLY